MGLIIGHRAVINISISSASQQATNQSVDQDQSPQRRIEINFCETRPDDHIWSYFSSPPAQKPLVDLFLGPWTVVATFSQSLSLLLFRCTWGSAQIIHSFIPNGRWWTSGLSSVQPRPLLETTVPISYSCANFTLFTFCTVVVYFGYERRTRVDRWWWWWLEGAFPFSSPSWSSETRLAHS